MQAGLFSRKNPFFSGAQFIDRNERVRVEGMDDGGDFWQTLSPDDGVDQRHAGLVALALDAGHAVASGVQTFAQSGHVAGQDGAQDQGADGEFIFDEHANDGAGGESSGIGDVSPNALDTANDLADGDDPDEGLDKAEEGREIFLAARDEDDAQSTERYVKDTSKED